MRTIFDHSQTFELRTVHRWSSIGCAVLSLVFICPQLRAQTAEPDLLKLLTARAGFDSNQIASIERGEAVAKVIPSTDRAELAVCGVVQVPSDPESALKAFQLSVNLDKKPILQWGKFSDPPRVEDLASLTLSDGDIDDLKRCTVGDCKLKFSAEMIHRFQRSIDWNASDYKEQANHLFRVILTEYVTNYIQQGDAALIEYADQNETVPLAPQQDSLLTSLPYVNDAAPEFVRDVKALPRISMPVARALTWTKIDFGLKPVVMVNDTFTYRSEGGGEPRVLVLTKQIYADHYFDSSLSLTASIGDQTGTKTNLLYANRSRIGALAKLFSSIRHEIVERKAADHLTNLLGHTRQNLDVVLGNSALEVGPAFPEGITYWRVDRSILWFVFLLVIALISFYARRSRKRRSQKSVSSHSNNPQLPFTTSANQ